MAAVADCAISGPMRLLAPIIPALLLALAVVWPTAEGLAEAAGEKLDGTEIEAIEEVVRNYLLTHPEILRDAANVLERRDREAAAERRRQAIAAYRPELEDDPDTPVMGNPDGDVTVVEFFDYRCPYCRGVVDDLMREVKADGNIRLVMKELPVLGPASVDAARAALAAAMQERYADLHMALMQAPGGLDARAVLSIARETGLDVPRLRRDMDSAEVSAMIERNLALAQALRVGGTPTFVIGETLVPGALDMAQLRHLVAQTRAGGSGGGELEDPVFREDVLE